MAVPRDLSKFLGDINWNFDDEEDVGSFPPSLLNASSHSSLNSSYSDLTRLRQQLSPDDNLGVAEELQSQQYTAINNLALKDYVEWSKIQGRATVEVDPPQPSSASSSAMLTQLLNMYVQQQQHQQQHGMFLPHPMLDQQMLPQNLQQQSSSAGAPSKKRPLEILSSGDGKSHNSGLFVDSSIARGQTEQVDDYEEEQDDFQASLSPKERRRERNKVLARKTRMKKKAELETLRSQVIELQTENKRLKMARYVLTLELLGNHKIPQAVRRRLVESGGGSEAVPFVNSVFNQSDTSMQAVADVLSKAQRSFCITNMEIDNYPIIYASPMFLEMTGYPVEEVVGKNCRFLQGKDTDKGDVARISEAISQGDEINIPLLNYRKDGSSFWNNLHLTPLKSQVGEVLLYVGIQIEITEEKAAVMKIRPSRRGGSAYSDGDTSTWTTHGSDQTDFAFDGHVSSPT